MNISYQKIQLNNFIKNMFAVLFKNRHELKIFITIYILGLLFISPQPQSMALNMLDLTTSIIDRGDVCLDEHHAMDVSFYDSRYVSGNPPGASFLAIPVYLLFHGLINLAENPLYGLNVLCILLITLPLTATLGILLFRFYLKIGTSVSWAAFLSMAYTGTTMWMSYGTSFFKRSVAGFILIYCFSELVFKTRNGEKSLFKWIWLGFVLGFTISVDYAAAPLVAIISIISFLHHRNLNPLKMVPGFVLSLALLFRYHTAAYGSPLATSYTYRVAEEAVLSASIQTFSPLQVLSDLFSLRGSLLTYYPIMILGLIGAYFGFRRKDDHFWAWICILACFLTTALLWGMWAHAYLCERGVAQRIYLLIIPLCGVGLPYAFKNQFLKKFCWLFIVPGLIINYLTMQTGLMPSNTVQIVFAIKVFITSLGVPSWLSEELVRALGIQTIHTHVARPDVSFGSMLSMPSNEIMPLLGNSLITFGVWIVLLVVFFIMIKRLWHINLNRLVDFTKSDVFTKN
ncbi:MAG: hypothetical protein H8E00_00975 [Deltaproteobacteria bacterium]|nr:hypothetical protein [Deltaproteobacteria bacterium]